MSDEQPSPDPAQASGASNRLDSWKEIAAYLKRDVTTVRRWEKREGLPVHRHRHEHRESVYAFAGEIDQWWTNRRSSLADNGHIDESSPNGVEPAATQPRFATPVIAAAIGLAVGVVLAVLFQNAWPRDGMREAQYRFGLFPPDQMSFGSVSLSPDGRVFAFTASTAKGPPVLFIRALDEVVAKPLPDTEGASFPFWSPSSDQIGFFANGKLRAIDLSGARPRIVCDAPNGRGGTWNRHAQIVFAPDRIGPLARVPAAGGEPTPVSELAPGERGHLWPEFLPDGTHYLYLADSAQPQFHNLFVGALDSNTRKLLVPLLLSNAAVAGDHIFFAKDRQLLATPFDARRLALTGESVVVGNDVLQQWQMDHKADFSASASGAVVFRSLRGPDTQLVWRDRSERQSAVTGVAAQYFEPTLSPDQRRIAVDVFDPRPSKRHGFGAAGVTSDIWLMDSETGASSRLTFDPSADFDPLWSPDGTRIAFSSNRRGSLDLYQRRLNGADGDELLFASSDDKHAQAWSPDGRLLVYAVYNPKTKVDLWLLPMSDIGVPVPLISTEASEEQAQISPDGRWIAYSSDESGRDEVYVQSFPTPGGKWQVSTDGGGDPRWRPDGNELFYLAEDRRLMSVPVKSGRTFEKGEPVALFDTAMRPHWGEGRNHYDVSRDGQRFLLMTPVADDRLSPFTIVLNWSPERVK